VRAEDSAQCQLIELHLLHKFFTLSQSVNKNAPRPQNIVNCLPDEALAQAGQLQNCLPAEALA
jgi:hypothetical protein